jgi:hypothetical protein
MTSRYKGTTSKQNLSTAATVAGLGTTATVAAPAARGAVEITTANADIAKVFVTSDGTMGRVVAFSTVPQVRVTNLPVSDPDAMVHIYVVPVDGTTDIAVRRSVSMTSDGSASEIEGLTSSQLPRFSDFDFGRVLQDDDDDGAASTKTASGRAEIVVYHAATHAPPELLPGGGGGGGGGGGDDGDLPAFDLSVGTFILFQQTTVCQGRTLLKGAQGVPRTSWFTDPRALPVKTVVRTVPRANTVAVNIGSDDVNQLFTARDIIPAAEQGSIYRGGGGGSTASIDAIDGTGFYASTQPARVFAEVEGSSVFTFSSADRWVISAADRSGLTSDLVLLVRVGQVNGSDAVWYVGDDPEMISFSGVPDDDADPWSVSVYVGTFGLEPRGEAVVGVSITDPSFLG